MYVCHCQGVTDRRVRAELAAGARDLCDLADTCGAGAECGGCHPMLEELLAEHHDRHRNGRSDRLGRVASSAA